MHVYAHFRTLPRVLSPVTTMTKQRVNAALDEDAHKILMQVAKDERRSPGNMMTVVILEWALMKGMIQKHELPEPDEDGEQGQGAGG